MEKMEQDEYFALKNELERLRAVDQSTRSGKHPETVELLRDMLNDEHNEKRIIVIMSLLSNECRLHNLIIEEEGVHRDMVRRFPDAPMPLISLAEFLLYMKNDFDDAIKVARSGIRIARKKGDFVRHAYNTLARIARKTENYQLLEETVDNLIDYKPNPGSQDVAYEYDFLVDLPKSAINSEKMERYRNLPRNS